MMFLIVALTLLPVMAQAQSADSTALAPTTSTVAHVKKEHSPQKALLLSIIPGGGQVYNRQAWKIPIIYAALGGVAYYCHSNYTQMQLFKDEYLYRQQHGGATNLAQYANYPTTNIYNMYESYNKNFQLSIIGIAAVYALNLVDAYVFGHLFDFEINDDLTLRVTPTVSPFAPMGRDSDLGAGLSMTLSF